jgi:CubicO group peptidase (beta-lactamase class C family)
MTITRRLPLAASLLCAAIVLGAADRAPFTFPRSTPEAQGISSAALLGFIDAAEKQVDALHSFMLVRHGQVVAEGWWSPYAADEPHVMYSLSKSFTSTAVGLAVAEGKLTVDDLVLGFFPDSVPADPSANLRAMKVRDLLTMSTGQHDEDIQNFPYLADENLVKKFLALPVAHKPGTLFVYNTPASYMLSAIVQKVTGQTVVDYLGPRLFEPLGIKPPVWEASKQGISLGGFGLNIRTEDIARFGQLYLQKGMWQGKPLLPAAWVEAATSRQMSNGSSTTSDWEQGYGYQFWRCRHGFYRGDGAFGQYCIILPQYDAVIAITSGTRDMPGVLNLIWDRLIPALKPAALSTDKASSDRLASKLSGLMLPAQAGEPTSAAAKSAVGRRYTLAPNAQTAESIALDSIDARGEAAFTIRTAGADQHLVAAPGAWRKASMTINGVAEPVAASGGWTADDTYTLKVARYRTPFVITYRLRFAGDQVVVDTEQNAGFSEPGRFSQWVGRAQPEATQGSK